MFQNVSPIFTESFEMFNRTGVMDASKSSATVQVHSVSVVDGGGGGGSVGAGSGDSVVGAG